MVYFYHDPTQRFGKNSMKGKLSDFLLPGLMLADQCWKFSALRLGISGILRRVLYFMYL